ncbi:MAG: DUF4214 domain-containing protein, partial [Candidatus Competibacterales bacterium]
GEGRIGFEGSGFTLGPLTRLDDGVTYRQTVTFDPSQSEGLILVLEASAADNPVTELRFLLPGHEATHRTQPFNPAFLAAWEKYRLLRFTHPQGVWDFAVEGETHVTDREWSDRMLPEDFRYGLRWPYEMIAALGNTLETDVWIHVPHTASRDYTRHMAAFFAQHLDPERRIFVEYSNECWNGISTTYQYAEAQGVALDLFDPEDPTANPYFAALSYCAIQAVDHTNAFEEHFARLGRADQVVRVFGAFIGNRWIYARDEDDDGVFERGALFESRTRFQRPAHRDIDVIAVANYFGGELGLEANLPYVATWTVDDAFDYLQSGQVPDIPPRGQPDEPPDFFDGGLPGTLAALADYSALSAQLGRPLVTYEGGPHLVTTTGDGTVNQLLVDLLGDPRMETLMTDLLDGSRAVGVTLQTMFDSAEVLDPEVTWARFGFLEHVYQDRRQAPRWSAADRWIDANPPWWDGLQAVDPPPLTTTPAVVEALYRGVLGRPPGADEQAAGLALPPGQLVEALLSRDEFIEEVAPVSRLFGGALDRLPDAAGLQYWLARLAATEDRLAIAAAFANAPEFTARLDDPTDPEAFVQALYQNVLGRLGDAEGVEFWLTALAGGQSRGEVLDAFAQSPENRHRTAATLPVALLYQALLDRPPTAEELRAGGNMPVDVLVAALLGEV